MEDLNQRKHDLKMEENYHSNVMGTLATSLTEFSGRVQMKEGGAKSLAKEVEFGRLPFLFGSPSVSETLLLFNWKFYLLLQTASATTGIKKRGPYSASDVRASYTQARIAKIFSKNGDMLWTR